MCGCGRVGVPTLSAYKSSTFGQLNMLRYLRIFCWSAGGLILPCHFSSCVYSLRGYDLGLRSAKPLLVREILHKDGADNE